MNSKKRKEIIVKGFSVILTFIILGLILLTGPADAFVISLNIPDNTVEKGDSVSFVGSIEITNNENLPVDYLKLILQGPEVVECKFNANGSIIEGCKGIKIEKLGNASYEYGNGYGYYGYGYNFGYGYGYTNGNLIYNFTLNSTKYIKGNYLTNLIVFIDDKEFSQKGDDLIIFEAPMFNLSVFSPSDSIYNTRKVPFNLTTSEKVKKIEYINWNDKVPKFKALCVNCDNYGYYRKKIKTLNEGENNITFRATDNLRRIKTENISLFIDSKDPQIRKTEPRTGFTNGTFSVEFYEENPKNLSISFGNNKIGYRTEPVDLSKCYKEVRSRYDTCIFKINLTDYDGQKIEYWVELIDIAENKDKSRKRVLDVDLTPPIVNSINYEIKGKYIYLLINISEPYLHKVEYRDDNLRLIKICNSLDNGMCEKRLGFKEGVHNLTIEAFDKVGFSDSGNISFFIDSIDPRIYQTEPQRGFANGKFSVEFKEENPKELWINYGNFFVDYRAKKINLSECDLEKERYECNISVNLSDYDRQEIKYWFNLSDVAGNYDKSSPVWLDVDFSKPIVNYFDYSVDKRRVNFVLNVSELNFDKINYIDNSDKIPKEKLLCSSLRKGVCERSKAFRVGNHSLTIEIVDRAGNIEEINDVVFDIV